MYGTTSFEFAIWAVPRHCWKVKITPPLNENASKLTLIFFFSGVLASSIETSRRTWLADGLFEKYWTKTSKKKSQPDFPNPAKDSMVKLGVCSMIVEPHVFEITLYSVREARYTFLPPVGHPAQPVPNPAGPTYGFPYIAGGLSSNNTVPPISSTQAQTPSTPAHSLQPVLPPFREGFAQFEPVGPHLPVPASFAASHVAPSVLSKSPSLTKRGSIDGSPGQDHSTNTDPVIQMLAARAATDHSLKSLMKVVASGSASPDELKTFQHHIDELNGIIQRNLPQPKQSDSTRSVHKEDAKRQSGPGLPLANITNAESSMPRHTLAPPSSGTSIKTEPPLSYYSQLPQAPKPKGTPPMRQDISAVVFDFTAGTGDRYLFPKYSLLEYLPGNTQVLASFLLTRSGIAANGGSYRKDTDYYQPVTIRLSTQTERTLEPLARVVAPVDEVRTYMNKIMDTMTPAENTYLATRLPRAKEDIPAGITEPLKTATQDTIKREYSPPNSLLSLYSKVTG